MSAPQLLFIAHCFPPVTLPGAVRAAKMCKFLAARGWHVTVLTPHPQYWATPQECEQWKVTLNSWGVHSLTAPQPFHWRIGEYYTRPSKGLRWFAEGLGRRVLARLKVPREILWTWAARWVIKSIDPETVDVILATASPYSSFELAQEASEILDRPFVLDYRDLWGTSPHPLPAESLRGVENESALCAAAHGILGVSDSLVANLRDNFGSKNGADHDKYHVITNGFDPDDMATLRRGQRVPTNVIYAGIFYPPKRTVTPIMEALRWIKENKPEAGRQIRFVYYGVISPHVQDEAKRCRVSDMVEIKGRVPRKEALEAIAKAGVSVVITSVETEGSQADRGIVTSKIFDAIGLDTPILLVAPRDSDAEKIVNNSAAGKCFRGEDTEAIAEAILNFISGEVPVRPSNGDSPYAWPQLSERLDQALRAAILRYEKTP